MFRRGVNTLHATIAVRKEAGEGEPTSARSYASCLVCYWEGLLSWYGLSRRVELRMYVCMYFRLTAKRRSCPLGVCRVRLRG